MKHKHPITLCLVSLVILIGATQANAQEFIKFCVTIPTTYTDIGHGEDYFAINRPQQAIGAYVIISRSDRFMGELVWQGFANEGSPKSEMGCTPNIEVGNAPPTGTWSIVVWPDGKVQGNSIGARRRESHGDGRVFSFAEVPIEHGSGTYTVKVAVDGSQNAEINGVPVTTGITSNYSDYFNVYQAAAYALYRHAGGMTEKNYHFRVGDNFPPRECEPRGGCLGGRDTKPCDDTWSCYEEDTGIIWIGSSGARKKFQIVNNLGRKLGDWGTHGKMADADCSRTSTTCPNGASSQAHSMGSREAGACAVQEGFAHFYSADVWNNHDQSGCMYEYFVNEFGNDSSPLINCESGNAVFPGAYMETRCGTPWEGRGIELDWFRLFWDLHTNENAAQPAKPTFTEILRWLDSADAWGADNAYNRLNAAIDNRSVGENLRVRWNALKGDNGVDHPNQ